MTPKAKPAARKSARSTKSKAPPVPRAEAPHATGRLPVDVDPETVRKLAAINCSVAEIAAVTNVSPDTIQRRFAAVMEKGREEGRASLKRKQYERAMGGSDTMLIWLGKQLLGQTDKQAHDVTTTPRRGALEPAERDAMLADWLAGRGRN